MAGKRDSLVLFLELRMSRKVDGELRKVKNKVKKASRGMIAEIKNVFKRATIFRFSTIAINSFFNSLTFARQEAIKFQSAMAQIVKLDMPRFLNLTSDATKVLGNEISRLAGEYNSTREAAATAYKTIVTAGFRGAKASKLFQTALLATASAGLSANNAISLLVSAMKQFNFGVNSTEKALDQLLVIQSNAAIGFGEFSGAFRSGGAALAGMTENLAQAGALIAALAETTRESGSVVGTFFKTVGARIVGRAATRQQFQKLGIDIEVEGRMRPILDLLDDLSDKIADMSDVRKGEVLSVIAGQRQINRLIILLNNLGRVRDLQAQGEKASGDARRRAAIEQQTFSAKWNKMQIQFVQRLEDKLLPSLDTFINAAGLAADAIVWIATKIENAVLGFAPGLLSGSQTKQETDVFRSRREAVGSQVGKLPEGTRRKSLEGLLKRFDETIIAIDNVGDLNFKFKTITDKEGNVVGATTRFQQEEKEKSRLAARARALVTFAENQLKSASSKLSAAALKRFQEQDQLRSPGATESTGARLSQSISDAFLGPVETRATEKNKNALAMVNERLAQTYEQILHPASSFNDSLIGTRAKLQALMKIRLEPLTAGLKRAQEQFDLIEKGFKKGDVQEGTVITARQNLKKVQADALVRRRQEEAKLLEADANALRRLNTRLKELGDKTREASSQVGSATNRLAKAQLDQASAANTLRLAQRGVGVALANYRVGLMMAESESARLGGNLTGLAQELANLDTISNVIDKEIQLDTLRRESLSNQLDLVKRIIDKQEGIGLSFLTSGAGQRNDIFKGFGALSQIFGQFGGDASKFQGLSDDELNQFGRTILALPEQTRKAMVDALGFLPEGATIAGFGSDQLRSMLSSAALGRGAGVSNVQDLRKRAAEATMELARLNTDELATSIQSLQTANKQLDQAQAQTELQRIRVAQAREHLQVVMRGQSEQRQQLTEQIAFFKQQSGALRESQTTNIPLHKRLQEADKSVPRSIIASEVNGKTIFKDTIIDPDGPMGKLLEGATKAYQESTERILEMTSGMREALNSLTGGALDAASKPLPTKAEVAIHVANELKMHVTDIAEVPQLVADTIASLPEIKDFQSFKNAMREIVEAFMIAINTGQVVAPETQSQIMNLGGK
jgi:TP901 family phage tail tape measure protein